MTKRNRYNFFSAAYNEFLDIQKYSGQPKKCFQCILEGKRLGVPLLSALNKPLNLFLLLF